MMRGCSSPAIRPKGAVAPKINRSFLFVFILAYFCLTALLFHNIAPVLLLRHNHDLMQDLGLWFKKHTPHQTLIICHDEKFFIGHYSGRKTVRPPLIKYSFSRYTAQDERLLQEFKIFLNQTLKENIPVFVTSSALGSYDPQRWFSNFMEENFRLEYAGKVLTEDWHGGEMRQELYY